MGVFLYIGHLFLTKVEFSSLAIFSLIFLLHKKLQVGRKRKYEDLDFSEDQISRKSVRQMLQKKNADSKNGSANGSPDPTPAASPSPEEVAINEWSWEKALCSDPEALMRQASRHSESEAQSHLALQVNNCYRVSGRILSKLILL